MSSTHVLAALPGSHLDGVTALNDVRADIGRIPLENISTLAKGALGDPDVIPLWFGEGDLAAPAFVGEAMAQAVRDGHVFYTAQNGISELRGALAEYHTRLGARHIGPGQITVTTSGMHAIMLAIQLLVLPGDNIVIVDPVWPNISGAARVAQAEVRSVRMDHGPAGWTLDLEKLAAATDNRTRIIFFASPGNPTGAVIPPQTQAAMLDLCRARGIWMVADEVYHRITFDMPHATSILDFVEPEDRVLVVQSFSKSWAMTGWRLGWMVHPPSLGPTLAMLIQYSNSGVATFLQHAGVAAVGEGEPFVARVRDHCRQGMAVVCDALEGFGKVRLGPWPTAGMYAYFEVDGLGDSRAACLRILRETKVGLAPGYFFGPGSDHFLRICVARSMESLTEAMGRLAPLLD
jgi:aspartate/methionine/tyrosine aminotransferase